MDMNLTYNYHYHNNYCKYEISLRCRWNGHINRINHMITIFADGANVIVAKIRWLHFRHIQDNLFVVLSLINVD